MKLKILALITFVLASYGVNAQIDRSQQPKPGPAPAIQLQVPKEFKLANGMTVLLVENHKLPRVSYNLRIDNMPSLEGDKAGVSSLLAAMLGNGTTNIAKDDFNEEVDFLGASLNFGSSSGFASGLSKYSDRILELMADATINPLFVQEEFDKEIAKQIEGLKSGEKSVDAVSARVGDALSYGVHHPKGEFISEETLNNITLDNVRSFYEERFNPSNAYLVVIGDFDAQQIEQKIKELFGNWKTIIDVKITMPEATPNVAYTQINFVDMPNAVQSDISVTNNVFLKMSDPDYHAVLLANYILGGGGSAYLFQNLRETHGYTYGSYSGISDDKYVSRFNAEAKVRNEVTDSSVVEIIKEINRIKTELVSEEDLAKAKALFFGSFVRALERPQTIANYALDIKIKELSNDYYTSYLQKINAVTPEDIKRAANTYFKPENARIIIIGKGSDILENLEKTGIPIKYFDPYANPVEKPVFTKPIPSGVTAQSVIDNYIQAIGGKDNAMAINTVFSSADVTIAGAPPIKATIKQMAPNKESFEMSIEGMGTIMKQKFNGTTGYREQQGQKIPMAEKELSDKQAEKSLFPELDYSSSDLTLESAMTIDGADVYKIKVTNGADSSFRYYSADTGFLLRTEKTDEVQGQSVSTVIDLNNYTAVNGVHFPYQISQSAGPQTIVFNINNVVVNESVSDEDFN